MLFYAHLRPRNRASPFAEPYLTVVPAAEHLSVHPSTIRRWIERGRLPSYRLSEKRVGVKPSDLARLVAPRPARPQPRGPLMHSSQTVIPPLTKEQQRRLLRALGGRLPFVRWVAEYGA